MRKIQQVMVMCRSYRVVIFSLYEESGHACRGDEIALRVRLD